MKEIRDALIALGEEKNADFQAKLTPTVAKERFLGVRVPALRSYAKSLKNTPQAEEFLSELPHYYYDEYLLHSVLLSEMRDYEKCLEHVREFLPYVDNWAVCDTLRPKSFSKHKSEVLPIIKKWIESPETYTCRFGIDMLMTYYLDKEFHKSYLELPAGVKSEEYYVNMMIAWYYATALAKQWNATIPYIENKVLSVWTHNKTIQKAIESYRITDEQKKYLRELKRKG